MKTGFKVIYFKRPEVHKNVVWSDGKKYFEGFLGSDNSVYRKTSGKPVMEPEAIYWTEKPKTSKDEE